MDLDLGNFTAGGQCERFDQGVGQQCGWPLGSTWDGSSVAAGGDPFHSQLCENRSFMGVQTWGCNSAGPCVPWSVL